MSPKAIQQDIPLCVDLDGTLIRTDLLWESVMLLVKQLPWTAFLLPIWLLRGRAHLKREVAKRVHLDAACLPYRTEALEWLESERAAGRRLVLTTAADQSLANAVAVHLGLFEEVIGSNGIVNLKGAKKLEAIEKRLGDHFDYAGDSRADQVIWNRARRAIAMDASPSLVRELERTGKLERTFERRSNPLRLWLRALRWHQWSKNLLIFVPVLTSHRILETATLLRSARMFLAFCACASALYVINDLLDLSTDRLHPQKRGRPFARGDLPIIGGLLVVPLLLAAALGIAIPLGVPDTLILIGYGVVSLSYSLRLKSQAPLDVFLLSGLYTIRILAGGTATHIWLSGWLLSFSVFLFLSLAFTKRLSELRLLRDLDRERSNGRGYLTADLDLVTTFAVSSGFIAALVLTFYVNSDQVRILYRQPLYLWMLFPVLLYWLTKLWMLAFRGQLAEDPVSYAIKAPSTYWAGLVSLLLILVAKFDLPTWFLP